eukprot:m51a1_g4268 putative abc transporter substrate-binding protein (464) ;mRNA; r:294589-296723
MLRSLLLLPLLCLWATIARSATSCTSATQQLFPSNATGKALMVVGQSAAFTGPHSQRGIDMRLGMLVAFAEANEVSPLHFVLASLDDAYDSARQQSNVEQLLCTGANGTGPAFAIAGTIGSSASEDVLRVLQASVGTDGVPVPYIGAATSSEKLRTQSAVAQKTGGRRAGVVLARAGGGDEMFAIVSFLSSNWAQLTHTSVFYENTPFAREAVGYLNASLKSIGRVSLLSSYGHDVVTSPSDLSTMAEEAVRALCSRGGPRAVVVLATGNMSAALMMAMSSRNKTGVRVVDKTTITREDLDSIKGEMALTASLHHPNLLMLLGYSESKTDLLIVSEYMASGSLRDYLKKNKQNMNYYNQVAIAFKEPERRPSVFQILRNWPQTFADIGNFEMPTDLSVSSPATPRNVTSEVSTMDARDVLEDEMMAAVLPQQLVLGMATPTLSKAAGGLSATQFPDASPSICP